MTRTILFVGGALVALAFLAGRRSADQSATVRALQAANDSLRTSRPAFDTFQRRVDTVTVHARTTAATDIRSSAVLLARADSIRAANAPSRPATPSDTVQATGGHPTESDALRGALAAQEAATAALTVALDTMTAARDSAVERLAQAERVARQGLVLARGSQTLDLGLLRVPRPPKWVTAAVGCVAGAYLDRQEPLRGCGLAASALLLVVPAR